MRTIIILQAIIILLGAYYLFTQSQEKVAVTPDEVPSAVVVPTVREGYTPPTENPPRTETTDASSSTSGIVGHSDVGMEYPVMDETLPEVR